ncbi:MAG: hypothetical protein AAF645_25320 [Myxococcota bacterium]
MNAQQAEGAALRAAKLGVTLVLGMALFFFGWLFAHRSVGRTAAELESHGEAIAEENAGLRARADAAEARTEAQTDRLRLLEARRSLAMAAFAVEDENFGVARTHLARAKGQAAAELGAEVQIVPEDADFTQEELRRAAERIDRELAELELRG